ncbi:MAG: discoidin domain-containing protein [Myxococcota bacterium]
MHVSRLLLPFVLLTGCGEEAEPFQGDMFSPLRLEEVDDRGAFLRFTTALETSCEAELGLSPAVLDQTFLDPNMDPDNPYAFDHEVPLVGLDPDTEYYVRARAEDRSGFVYLSETLSFRTRPEDASPTLVPGTLVNVASRDHGTTVAMVSSNFGPSEDLDSGFGLHKALDGDMRSAWSTHFDGDEAAFELDLGQPRRIQRVGFQSRQMTDGTSIIRSFELQIGGESFGPFATPNPDQRYEFEIDALGRQVRFDAVETSGGNTGAMEFELFAPLD